MSTAVATTTPTSVQLTIPEPALLSTIESIVEQAGLFAVNGTSHFTQALTMAQGIKKLREALSDKFLNEYVVPLQGSRLGFKTDKDTGNGYPLPVLRDCVIECLLRGGHLHGNEFNIIAGNAYFTKEFFTRMVAEVSGLTDLSLMPGVPAQGNGGALVPFVATWKLNGKSDSMECIKYKLPDGTELDGRITVRVNAGSGADQILGKAERKMLARVYKKVTGSNAWEGEDDDTTAIETRSASIAKRLQASGPGEGETVLGSVVNAETAGNGKAATAQREPGDEPAETKSTGASTEWTQDELDELFNNYGQKLEIANSISDVGSAENMALGSTANGDKPLPAEVKAKISQMAEAARAEIRSKRGK